MVIFGLTGSIAMGKTVTARMYRQSGVSVHDADALVHELIGPGGQAVAKVEAAFPGCARGGAIDRQALGKLVFGDGEALGRLESLLHPMVRERRNRFLRQAAGRGDALVVLDIPLLFETDAQIACDAVVVVTAPSFLQKIRVLARPGMTEERLRAILTRQMPDAEKRRRADYIVPTGLGRAFSLRRVRDTIKLARRMGAGKWQTNRMRRE
jgi:dephospho-CoA kinase